MAANKLAAACRLCCQALVIAGSDQGRRQRAESLAGEVDQAGQKLLAEAEEKFKAANYADALKSFQRIAITFRGMPCSKKARERLTSVRNDPAVSAALKEAKAAALMELVMELIEAAREPLAAQAPIGPAEGQPRLADEVVVAGMEPEGQADIVKDLETIVKDYADTPTVDKADLLLKRLRADKKIMSAVKKWDSDKAAGNLLARARMYRSGSLDEKAVQYYQELINKYPKTEFAAEARKELLALRVRDLSALPYR